MYHVDVGAGAAMIEVGAGRVLIVIVVDSAESASISKINY